MVRVSFIERRRGRVGVSVALGLDLRLGIRIMFGLELR